MFKKGFVLFSLFIVLFSGVNFSDNTIQAHDNKHTTIYEPMIKDSFTDFKGLKEEEFEQVDKKLEPYIYYDNDQVKFDYEKAKKEGLEEQYIEVGNLLNSFSHDMSIYNESDIQSDIEIAKLKFPVWGNWCGPGHGGGPVKDVLDNGCKQHDLCYGKRGYFACSCDGALIKYIDRNQKKMKIVERTVAAAIKTYFKKTVCNPFK